MEYLMSAKDDGICQEIIRMFSAAHDAMLERTEERKYQFATIELIKWCVELHRKMREFSTQDRLLVKLAMHYIMIPDMEEVETAAMKSRDIGASTQSLYLESASYTAPGTMYLMPGHGDAAGSANDEGGGIAKGAEMLQNAVITAFPRGTNHSHELDKQRLLVIAILDETDNSAEVVEVVESFRELAVEQSRKEGRLSFYELEVLGFHVRVCEVVHATLQPCCEWRTHAANVARSVPVCILACAANSVLRYLPVC